MRKIASILPVVMLLIFILATFDSIAKEKRLQFTNGIDTINNTKIEKLWPLGKDPAKELELGRRTLIFFVGIRNNTIFVLSETPKLFYNDKYEYDTRSDIIEAFPNTNMTIQDGKTYVTKSYGSDFNCMSFIDTGAGYTLYGGQVSINTFFTISKKCKIGTSVQDLFEFLGLTLLDIDVTDKIGDWFYLVINSEYKEIGSPMNSLGGGPINGGPQVFMDINNKKIREIVFGYYGVLGWWETSFPSLVERLP